MTLNFFTAICLRLVSSTGSFDGEEGGEEKNIEVEREDSGGGEERTTEVREVGGEEAEEEGGGGDGERERGEERGRGARDESCDSLLLRFPSSALCRSGLLVLVVVS